MHCPRCGNAADAGQQFCRKCGLNLEKVAELLGEAIVAPESSSGEIARLRELQHKHESWSAIAGLLTFELILLLFITIVTLMILKGGVLIVPGSILILLGIAAGVMGYFQASAKLLKQKLAQPQLPDPALPAIEASAPMPPGSIADRTTELLNEPERLNNC